MSNEMSDYRKKIDLEDSQRDRTQRDRSRWGEREEVRVIRAKRAEELHA